MRQQLVEGVGLVPEQKKQGLCNVIDGSTPLAEALNKSSSYVRARHRPDCWRQPHNNPLDHNLQRITLH